MKIGRTLFSIYLLASSWTWSAAQECENPWGGSMGMNAAVTIDRPEKIRLCLPPGFQAEAKEGGYAFGDPKDEKGERGRLGIALTLDSNYKYSDSRDEYESIKAWLCRLANTSVSTVCSITEIQGSLYVVLKELELGSHTESYIHMGNGFLLALTAEAPTDAALEPLRAVISGVRVP